MIPVLAGTCAGCDVEPSHLRSHSGKDSFAGATVTIRGSVISSFLENQRTRVEIREHQRVTTLRDACDEGTTILIEGSFVSSPIARKHDEAHSCERLAAVVAR